MQRSIIAGYYLTDFHLLSKAIEAPESAAILKLWIQLLCVAQGRQGLLLLTDTKALAAETGEPLSAIETALAHMEAWGIIASASGGRMNQGLPDVWRDLDDDL